MPENPKSNEKITTTLDIVTDDSGMYGAYYCSNCNWRTESHDVALKLSSCPGCKLPISGINEVGYPFGGSDF